MNSIQCLRLTNMLICMVGILLSVYALYVELKKEKDPKYTATCDISEHMSCSKVFTSKYGKGFGLLPHILGEKSPLNLPNGFFGIIYYSLCCITGFSNNRNLVKLQVLFGIAGIVMAVYLAYILYFILYDFCVVCVTTYALNVVIFILSVIRLNHVEGKKQKST